MVWALRLQEQIVWLWLILLGTQGVRLCFLIINFNLFSIWFDKSLHFRNKSIYPCLLLSCICWLLWGGCDLFFLSMCGFDILFGFGQIWSVFFSLLYGGFSSPCNPKACLNWIWEQIFDTRPQGISDVLLM